jgi:lariat debranching enzyme
MIGVAVTGCVHGELDMMYERVDAAERHTGIKVDLILCTGDFQALRGDFDLPSMSCPPKYRKLGDFHHYYLKHKFARIPTIVVGGNHESTLYFSTAPHGGFIAPNIYYLGRCGVVNFGDLRIAGISGIYNQRDYLKPLPAVPRNEKHYETLYKVRKSDVDSILRISSPDVFMSHDWPLGIYNYGDTEALMRKKPFLREQVSNDSLGSPANKLILDQLAP